MAGRARRCARDRFTQKFFREDLDSFRRSSAAAATGNGSRAALPLSDHGVD